MTELTEIISGLKNIQQSVARIADSKVPVWAALISLGAAIASFISAFSSSMSARASVKSILNQRRPVLLLRDSYLIFSNDNYSAVIKNIGFGPMFELNLGDVQIAAQLEANASQMSVIIPKALLEGNKIAKFAYKDVFGRELHTDISFEKKNNRYEVATYKHSD